MARAETSCYLAANTPGGLSSILNSDCYEVQLVQGAGLSSSVSFFLVVEDCHVLLTRPVSCITGFAKLTSFTGCAHQRGNGHLGVTKNGCFPVNACLAGFLLDFEVAFRIGRRS